MFVTYAELREPVAIAPDAVALLPLGAMETHGPHLPLGTDGVIAEGIIDRAVALCDGSAAVLRLPLLWLGASAEHAQHAGTLSHEPEAVIAQIVALAEGLHHAGLQRMVLFNGHGGNVAALSIAALKLRSRFGFLAANAHWLDFGLPEDVAPPTPVREDVHGGWVETSVMLHLAPQLVEMSAARPQPARPPASLLSPTGPIRWGWLSDDLGDGWIGRPELADVAIGRAMVDHAAKGLNGLLSELAVAPWRTA